MIKRSIWARLSALSWLREGTQVKLNWFRVLTTGNLASRSLF